MILTYECATERDIDVIFGLSRDLILRYEDTTSIDLSYVLAWVRKKITTQIGDYTRILRDGEHVGYLSFRDEGERFELDDLYIFSPYQGQGIGGQAIRDCLRQADRSVYLYVFVQNTRARCLYERLGFRIKDTVHKTRYVMEYAVENTQ